MAMTRELARELKTAAFRSVPIAWDTSFIRLSAVVNGAKIPGVTV